MDWLADVCPLRRRCASAAHWRVSGIVLGVRLVPGLGLGRRDSYRQPRSGRRSVRASVGSPVRRQNPVV
jgi:hypothetical protein